MTHCPLCGAKNPDTNAACYLCDSLLKEEIHLAKTESGEKYVYLDTVDASTFKIHWRKFATVLAVLLVIALPWLLMAPLLEVPADVENTRTSYDSTLSNYFNSRDTWDQRKDQLLQTMHQYQANPDLTKSPMAVGDLPIEVFFAYLNDNLDFFRRINSDLAIYPILKKGERPRITFSKYQTGLWPLKVLLSVDVELITEGSKVTPKVIRFRRGAEETPVNLAWSYFAPELQVFRQLESIQSGIVDFSMHEKSADVVEGSSSSPVFFSLKYLPMPKPL